MGVAFFLNEIREIIIVFFVSLLFAAALDPMVDSLERKRIPRSIGILIIYVGVISIIGLFIANLAPIVAKEVSELASKVQDLVTNLANGDIPLPSYLERLRPLLREAFEGINVSKAGNYREVLLKVAQQLSSVAGNVFNAVMVLFNGFFNAILILVITYLMTVDEVGIDKFVLSLFPARYGDYIRHKSRAIKEKMGYWLRGQVILCIVVGILVYVGFGIIGIFGQRVEYAATIALLAGFTELIPYAGPFIAWLLALPIVANQSIPLILWMTMLMYLVQLLENNFIVPIIMNKAVGISPILIMFAMLVGFEFLGVLGIVLSVPVATTFAIFLKDYADRQK
ncbi:AI-2E family transporter [Candidatus Peregrinibacteria bacterium]|nr:AI-2E family transporter [Candidatus Peregrinibacteria bacterium]